MKKFALANQRAADLTPRPRQRASSEAGVTAAHLQAAGRSRAQTMQPQHTTTKAADDESAGLVEANFTGVKKCSLGMKFETQGVSVVVADIIPDSRAANMPGIHVGMVLAGVCGKDGILQSTLGKDYASVMQLIKSHKVNGRVQLNFLPQKDDEQLVESVPEPEVQGPGPKQKTDAKAVAAKAVADARTEAALVAAADAAAAAKQVEEEAAAAACAAEAAAREEAEAEVARVAKAKDEAEAAEAASAAKAAEEVAAASAKKAEDAAAAAAAAKGEEERAEAERIEREKKKRAVATQLVADEAAAIAACEETEAARQVQQKEENEAATADAKQAEPAAAAAAKKVEEQVPAATNAAQDESVSKAEAGVPPPEPEEASIPSEISAKFAQGDKADDGKNYRLAIKCFKDGAGLAMVYLKSNPEATATLSPELKRVVARTKQLLQLARNHEANTPALSPRKPGDGNEMQTMKSYLTKAKTADANGDTATALKFYRASAITAKQIISKANAETQTKLKPIVAFIVKRLGEIQATSTESSAAKTSSTSPAPTPSAVDAQALQQSIKNAMLADKSGDLAGALKLYESAVATAMQFLKQNPGDDVRLKPTLTRVVKRAKELRAKLAGQAS